jgi:hypothetical protein
MFACVGEVTQSVLNTDFYGFYTGIAGSVCVLKKEGLCVLMCIVYLLVIVRVNWGWTGSLWHGGDVVSAKIWRPLVIENVSAEGWHTYRNMKIFFSILCWVCLALKVRKDWVIRQKLQSVYRFRHSEKSVMMKASFTKFCHARICCHRNNSHVSRIWETTVICVLSQSWLPAHLQQSVCMM